MQGREVTDHELCTLKFILRNCLKEQLDKTKALNKQDYHIIWATSIKYNDNSIN